MSTEGQIAGLYHRARKTVLSLWCTGCDIRKRILLFMLFWLWKETENECVSSEELEFSFHLNLLLIPQKYFDSLYDYFAGNRRFESFYFEFLCSYYYIHMSRRRLYLNYLKLAILPLCFAAKWNNFADQGFSSLTIAYRQHPRHWWDTRKAEDLQVP
jgi:hypothetical protein